MLSVRVPPQTSPGSPPEAELGSLFVTALTEDSDTAWYTLLNRLSSLPRRSEDLGEVMTHYPDLHHYLHRTVQHALKYHDKLHHLKIIEKLAAIFPKETEQYKREELLHSYSYSDVNDIAATACDKTGLKKRKRSVSCDSPATKNLFAYSRDQVPATFRAPQLKLTDLAPAANVVSHEIGNVEKSVGHFVSPLQTGKLHVSHPSKSRSGFRHHTTVSEKLLLSPILSSELEQEGDKRESCCPEAVDVGSPAKPKTVRFHSKTERLSLASPEQRTATGKLKSAFDVIEAFASGKLQSESESIFLNYVRSTSTWNPYDLTVVSKTHTDPEHFVISKFGILHVYPDGESTLQSFAEWLQEASLFTMLKQIPFFRFYLLKRAFSRWYRNMRYDQFAKIHSQISHRLLRSFPNFQEAILKIQNLSEELLTVSFHLLLPLGEYSQETYQHSIHGSQTRAQKFLQRYFKYCKRTVKDVLETTQSRALELETEKQHQPFVSELPLSVQKEKHAKLEKDLKVAKYRASRLGDFVTLVEHLVYSCLLNLARQNAQAWVDTSLKHTTSTESVCAVNSASKSVYHSTPASKSVTPASKCATPASKCATPASKSVTPVSKCATPASKSTATASKSATPATSVAGERTSHSQQAGDCEVEGSGELCSHPEGKGRLGLLCAELQFAESGTLITHPSMKDLETALLEPLHAITNIITTTTQPLPDGGGPTPSGASPGMQTAASSLPTTKINTTVKRGLSPARPAGKTNSQFFLLPHHQKPKSLLKALKGITATISGDASSLPVNERVKVNGSKELSPVFEKKGEEEEEKEEGKEEKEEVKEKEVVVRRGSGMSVLGPEKFSHRIKQDGVLSASLAAMESAVNAVKEEVEAICCQYGWLGGVWQFLQQWEGRGRAAQLSAEEFETTLTQLHQWVKQVSHLPPHLPTPHSLVSVGTGEMVATVLPQLMAVLGQLKAVGVEHTRRVCERVLLETRQRSEVLSSKRYDLEGFAEYARQLRECQAFQEREGASIGYVLRVHTALGKHGVEVPAQDKALGQELRLLWGDFEGCLLEAGEFVATQTPMKAQGLQESIVSCEEELRSLVSQVNEGVFVDPTSPPLQLLEQLKAIQEEVSIVRARLLGLSKWKEAITGKPYDLSAVTSLLDMLFVRQELWKYRRTFDSYEREWTKTPFKKLDISLIAGKVSDWLTVCNKLEQTLPTDPVLERWKERLTELHHDIPLLQQLCSKALRTSHWVTIFAALGEDYAHFHPYTLTDFALYNIYEHSDIIFEICHDAMQEEKLRIQFGEMQDCLDAMNLSIVQTPLEHYPFAVSQSSTELTARKPGDKTTTFVIGVPAEAPRSSPNVLYSLGNDADLLLSLEDRVIQLKVMLSSPHLGNLRGRVEGLLATVRQLLELVSLLVDCQSKWLDLLHLFSTLVDTTALHSQHDGLESLQQATEKFQEVTQSIHDDPRLLSLLGKRRGQKGFREMQGEQLRQCFSDILSTLESVVQSVQCQLEVACCQCPRLSYLTDREILKVASNSGNPVSIIPLISKIFPAVHNLKLIEVSVAANDPSHTEQGVQLVAVEGFHGELLPLIAPLPLGRRPASQWLHALGGALSYSLACRLTECLVTFPEELMGTNMGKEDTSHSLSQWVCSHPGQCVLLSLELKWSSTLLSAAISSDPQAQLLQSSSRLQSAVNITAKLLRSYSCFDNKAALKYSKTFAITLQNVIITLRHKMDIVKSLLQTETFSPNSFGWKSHILYSTEDDLEQPTSEDTDVTKRHTAKSSIASIYTLGSNVGTSHSSLEQRSFGPTQKLQSSAHTLVASQKLQGSSHSLVASQKLQGSAHNIVASSRSLLNSRHTLLGNDLQREGESSSFVTTPTVKPKPTKCIVQCNEITLSYGYELAVCNSKLVLTPVTEECLVSLVTAIGGYAIPCISGMPAVGKSETAREVAKILGRHCFQFCCSPHTTLSSLHCLLAGSLRAGSILFLEGYLSLPPAVMVGLGAALQTLELVLSKSFGNQQRPATQSCASQDSEITLATNTNRTTTSPSFHPGHTPHPLPSTSQDNNPPASRGGTWIDWYTFPERWSASGGELADMELLGTSLTASSAFGCMLVNQVATLDTVMIPEQLRAAMRSVHLVSPSMTHIAEVLLLSHGFSDGHTLGRKIVSLMKHLNSQLSSTSGGCHFGLHQLKEIITQATHYLRDGSATIGSEDDSTTLEHAAVSYCILQLYTSRILPQDANKFQDLVQSYFPTTHHVPHESDPSPRKDGIPTVLVEAVQSELNDRHLQCLPALVDKITQLHFGLQHYHCAILTGPSGSSKTTCLRTLAAAYHHLGEVRALRRHIPEGEKGYPSSVNIVVINPAAHTEEELFGSYKMNAGITHWQDGILTRLLRQIESNAGLKQSLNHPTYSSPLHNSQNGPHYSSSVCHWVVLDGLLAPTVADAVTALVSEERVCLSSGEKLTLPASCKLLVETSSISHLTPSLLSHCALVHCDSSVLTFDTIIDTWLDKAPVQHNLSAMSTETLASMIKQLLPDTLEYLQNLNTKHSGPLYTSHLQNRVFGITETRCFFNFLSAVLERNSPKVDSSSTYAGTASRSSRVSSQMSVSRSSSAMFHSYSTSSVHVETHGTPRTGSYQTSRVDVDREALEPLNDDAFSECSNLEAEVGLSMQLQLATILSFSYIWSIGAFIPFSELSSYDEFARDQILQLPFAVSLPEEGSVFDYYLDLKSYQFLPWSERRQEGRDTGGYIALPEVERYAYIIDLHLSYGHNVMLVGEQGTGKTSFVKHLIQSRTPLTHLPISHNLTPSQLQHIILDKVTQLEKRSGHQRMTKKASPSQRCVFFLDDLHLARGWTEPGAVYTCTDWDSRVLETVRYAISQDSLLDATRNYQHDLHNVKYIASCVPSALMRVPPQLLSLFNLVPFFYPSDDCLQRIFSKSVLLWLQQFPEAAVGDPMPLTEAIAAASVTVFKSVSGRFHPTPSRPHFLFTLHDLMHVYEGLLLLSPGTKAQTQPQFSLLNRRGFLSSTQSGKSLSTRKTKLTRKTKSGKKTSLPSLRGGSLRAKGHGRNVPEVDSAEVTSTLRMLIRLWCHENTRVYADRLLDSKDRMWFLKLLEVCMKYCFCGIDLQGSTTMPPITGGHTAGPGARRVRGGRMRGANLPAAHTEGPSLADLASSGIKVETLQRLAPEDPDGDTTGRRIPKQLIAFDQLTLRGEDLTGLMFVQFPPSCDSRKVENRSETSLDEGEDKEQDEGDTSTIQESATYLELGDGQVMETLQKHLTQWKSQKERDGGGRREETAGTNVVLFRGAIEHATRLCRVMRLPGSHALLLGHKGTGRKSLVRLVAHIMEAKLFEVAGGSQDLRSQLREVCVSSAVEGRSTVLLVDSSSCSSQHWENICKIMNEGLCPGLFTSSELLVMSSKLQREKVKKTAEGALQAFARAVYKNLHVFIVWNTYGRNENPFEIHASTFKDFSPSFPLQSDYILQNQLNSEGSVRAVFHALCQACSHLDHYHPWSKQNYSDIALSWWQSTNEPKWQDWVETASQLEAVAILAAHVHLTSVELLQRSSPHSSTTLVSPQTFVECLKTTQNIAVTLMAEEKVAASRLKKALQKLEAVEHTVYEVKQELGTLQVKLAAAEQEVQQRMTLITAAKEKYMAASRQCKFAEETIETETRNVEQLNATVEEKFSEVSPMYHSALEALSSVQRNEILEVMGYRDPPSSLTPVFDALCMLFDRPQTWEDCKQLLLSHNFFESLRFFDRDNVPKHKLQKLEKMVTKRSELVSVQHGSRAVVPICLWVEALVDYHKAKMVVQPYRERLTKAERELMNANKTFVAMRKDMMETKSDLERTVKLHRESVQKARDIESEIEGVQAKLERATCLLSTMSAQRQKWDEKLKSIWSNLGSVPGHSVLSAASICYLPCVPPNRHNHLLSNWLAYCSGGVSLGSLSIPGHQGGGIQASQGYPRGLSSQQPNVRIQKDFSVSSILSTKEERSLWQQQSVFPDQITMDRCIAARACCKHGSSSSWPVIFDPNSHFERYFVALEEKAAPRFATGDSEQETVLGINVKLPELMVAALSKSDDTKLLVKLNSSDAALNSELKAALREGRAVMLTLDNLTAEADSDTLLEKILDGNSTNISSGREQLELDSETISIHPNFKLYVVVLQPLENIIQSSQLPMVQYIHRKLSSLCTINLGLSKEGLQSHLQRFIVGCERPEFGIRYKSLLTDLCLHQQQMEDSQERLLKCTLDVEDSLLLHHQSLLPAVRECEMAESTAADQIRETKKILKSFDQQIQGYKPLADYAAAVFTVVQTLSHTLKYFSFSLDQFQTLLSQLIARNKPNKVTDSVSAMNAHVLHLKHELLVRVCRTLSVFVFRRHQILLPFFVALEIQLLQGKLSAEEFQLLGREFAPVEGQINAQLQTKNDEHGGVKKPDWVTDEHWCEALVLQKQVLTFRKLTTEVISNSSEWKEYFELPPSLLAIVPGMGGDTISIGQKLLLWRTFQPEKFQDVSREFVLLSLGPGFSASYPSSVETIMSLTTPTTNTIVCMLSPGDDVTDKGATAVAMIETAAVQLGRKFYHHVSVPLDMVGDEQARWSKLVMHQLPRLSNEGVWVVIEHLHLVANWHQKLQSLLQAVSNLSIDKTSQDFRLWLLLPVDVCSGIVLTSSCLRVVMESDKKNDFTADSRNSLRLLQDIQYVVNLANQHTISYPHTHSLWESHEGIISQFQCLLPTPLSGEDLSIMSPPDSQGQSQSLLVLLYDELCRHNTALISIHASLQTVLGYIREGGPFSTKIGTTLTAICHNVLPVGWLTLPPFNNNGACTKMLPAIKVLKHRIEFYSRALRSGVLPSTVHPLWFSNPADLLSRMQQSFAWEHQLKGEEVSIKTRLLSVPEPSNLQSSTTFHGLALHGAVWNEQTSCLESPSDPSLDQEYYYVCMEPQKQLNVSDSFASLDLPVYVDWTDGPVRSCSTVLFSAPMRISEDLKAHVIHPGRTVNIYLYCTPPL